MLYKVRVFTDIMVVSEDANSAEEVAKANATKEIAAYSKAKASKIERLSEIPENWRDSVPYASSVPRESRTCKTIAHSIPVPQKPSEPQKQKQKQKPKPKPPEPVKKPPEPVEEPPTPNEEVKPEPIPEVKPEIPQEKPDKPAKPERPKLPPTKQRPQSKPTNKSKLRF